jgi:hypothetical protein
VSGIRGLLVEPTLVSTHDLLAGEIFWRHRKVRSRAFLLFLVTAVGAVDVGVAVVGVVMDRLPLRGKLGDSSSQMQQL